MTGQGDDILDDLFHGCAIVAYLEQARVQQAWPDREATRRLAYRLYEDELARKTPRKPANRAEFTCLGRGRTCRRRIAVRERPGLRITLYRHCDRK